MKMKNLFLAALAVVTLAGTAQAGAFYNKSVPLSFLRTNVSSDNPGSGTYSTNIANGLHGANSGVALVFQDTSAAIFVGDHFIKGIPQSRTMPVVASALLADSSWFGTLFLTGSTSTIDSLYLFRDVSNDGITWTAQDSIGGHIISDRAQIVTGAVSDSAQFIAASVSGINGALQTKLALSFTANAWFGTAGVTAQATVGVNYIRFRLHMTAGDFAAAGATNGVTASFMYPAQEPNLNR
jgi:hypothetical protein